MTTCTWRSAGITHSGLVRRDNQDNFYMSKDGRVFVVADGVGGYSGGGTASRIAVDTIDELWTAANNLNDGEIEEWMRTSVNEANKRIFSAADKNIDLAKMGTTIVLVVIGKNGNLHIGHAGDSRAVLVRGSNLQPLTTDHSFVMEMFLKGQLTREECKNNRYKHLITRCLGHDKKIVIDYSVVEPQPGDCFVLATDGLADELQEEEIGALVSGCDEPQLVCDTLLENVLERGGHDNTTIITFFYDGKTSSGQIAGK